jgi:hypothetical protein
MNKFLPNLLLLSAFAGFGFSQTVNICGRVTDPSGKPLTNTLVRLGQTRSDNGYGMSPYYTTTDSNGEYHLGSGTCTVSLLNDAGFAKGNALSRPMYVGGKVLFSLLQSDAVVKMSLHDLAGRRVRDVMNRQLSTGNYSVSIDTRSISEQFYLLRVTIGGAASVILLGPASHGKAGAVVQSAPGFQAHLEKLAAVVDTLHATEPGYALGVKTVEVLTGQYDFTLTKNNTWNGDTAAFWDTVHVKKEPGKIWYTILNRTNGQIPDSMIYWAIGDGGAANRLSNGNTVDFTTSGSGRLYIMVGYKPGNPLRPQNQCWDFEEHTNGMLNGTLWFHGNTTRVDAYGVPMAYRLHCTDGYDMVRGEDYHVYFQTRASFFAEFENEVPYEFSVLGTMVAPYRIPNPGSNGSAVAPGGKYSTYSDKYCAAFGVGSTPYLNGIALPQTSAGAHRHVLGMTSAQQNDDKNYYKAAPCNFYSYFLHRRAVANKCYGFPYDDYANGSSYLEHGNVSWVEIAVGY